MPVTVWVHEYVRGCYLSSILIIKIMVTIITLPLNYSPSPPSPSCPPTPNIHMQHHHTYVTVVLLSSSLSPSHTHLTLPILTLLLILPTHLFCTLLMVIFSEFDDLLWMHVYHVHVVMHIVMLKWCMRCYISCGLT